MTHKHEWMPTADQPGVEATTYFGWCECEETLDLTELCKRASATEVLSAEVAKRLFKMWKVHVAGANAIYDDDANALRAYAEKRGEG